MPMPYTSSRLAEFIWQSGESEVAVFDFQICKVNSIYALLRRQGDVISTWGPFDTLNAAVEAMMVEYTR